MAVSETRGLTFLEPVSPQLITRPELTEYLAATIDEEDQEELGRLQELYWLLGLLDPSVELYDLFLDLLGEQVLGLFNLETDELLVVAERTGLVLGRLVIVIMRARSVAHTDAPSAGSSQCSYSSTSIVSPSRPA